MSKEAVATQNTQVATKKSELTHSERFTNAVMSLFSSSAGSVQLTNFQKKLIQNYFIKIDAILRTSEIKRMAKSEQYREPLVYEWNNLNMQKLAVEVVAFSSVQLDPLQPNHINPIPYKNNHTNQYDITFIMGYRGYELKAKKYGFQAPDDVIVELVYEKDKFKSHKKNLNNKIESYDFDIVDDFDRGEIIGGFYYHVFHDKPEKNKLRVLTMRDIKKRIPKNASAEFWGGEKDKWVNGKKSGKEQVEGWFDEMVYKTIYIAAYNDITIDSEKIDEHFVKAFNEERMEIEEDHGQQVTIEIKEKANKKSLSFATETKASEPGQLASPSEDPAPKNEAKVAQPQMDGPGF